MCLRNRGTNWGGTGGRRTLAGLPFSYHVQVEGVPPGMEKDERKMVECMGVRYNVYEAGGSSTGY